MAIGISRQNELVADSLLSAWTLIQMRTKCVNKVDRRISCHILNGHEFLCVWTFSADASYNWVHVKYSHQEVITESVDESDALKKNHVHRKAFDTFRLSLKPERWVWRCNETLINIKFYRELCASRSFRHHSFRSLNNKAASFSQLNCTVYIISFCWYGNTFDS